MSDENARDAGPLTVLLDEAARGDRGAFDRAFALLYGELTALARAQRRRWVGNDTLRTTVLVHEAYIKLLGADPPELARDDMRWQGRRHFFALAAQVMRQILVNYAEAQRAAKRGGDAQPVSLDVLDAPAGGERVDPDADWLTTRDVLSDDTADEILALHEVLHDLEEIDGRRARIVECRFFAGLSIPATADALRISPATVKREWQAAREWLYGRLAERRNEAV